MRYVDFDGVILDTEAALFYEWRKNPLSHTLGEDEKIKYVMVADWHKIINESEVINDAIYLLNNMNYNESAILTKIHSLENEGFEKVKFLRSNGVKQPIILVPFNLKKVEMVDPFNNILIDDSLQNLEEWELLGGYPMFFDKNMSNIDSWGRYNENNYQRVLKINENKM